MADLTLVSRDDVKKSLGLTTTQHDGDLDDYIAAATAVVENITGPIVQRNATFTVDGGRGSVVLPVAFTAVVSVLESGVAITNYVAAASAGVIYAGTTASPRAFQGGTQNIVVTVTVGSTEIPANVALAARELIRFWWQQGRQGNRPSLGNEGVSEVDVSSGYAVPRRVIELLQANARMPGFA